MYHTTYTSKVTKTSHTTDTSKFLHTAPLTAGNDKLKLTFYS